MDCPSCGSELRKSSVTGLDESFRCDTCGGVWMAAWAVNRIAGGEKIVIRRERKQILVGGGNRCPTDEVSLSTPEDLPYGINAWQCQKCKWWWLAGDEVFRLAEAFAKKRLALARNRRPVAFALPALAALVILLAGLAVALQLVQMRQQVGVPAYQQR